jgi:hypothetical protein
MQVKVSDGVFTLSGFPVGVPVEHGLIRHEGPSNVHF